MNDGDTDSTNNSQKRVTPQASWKPIGTLDAIPPGSIIDVDNGETHLVWRTETGTVALCAARCPHLFAHFGVDGYVSGEQLVCSAHGWRFTSDGAATDRRGEPMRSLETWPTRVVGSAIEALVADPETHDEMPR